MYDNGYDICGEHVHFFSPNCFIISCSKNRCVFKSEVPTVRGTDNQLEPVTVSFLLGCTIKRVK